MKPWAVILAWLMTALPLAAQTNAPVRLALVSDSDTGAAAVDVLTAELSGNPQVQLLERDQIAKAYHEQGLSAANTDYLKLGQVLGADGLVILNQAGTGSNACLNVRLVAVKPGVVLEAERLALPAPDLPGWSELYARRLMDFLPKLTVTRRDAIPLSVINFRSAVLTEEAPESERQLQVLAIQRLSREPQFFVLERQQLGLATAEKELKGDEAAFWNGNYLLEGVIDQNGYSPDTITINARLTPPHGGKPVTFIVSGSRTNLIGVVNDLAVKIREALQVQTSAPVWNVADEAAQYFDEANWALKWGIYAEAQAASDSSWALGKQDLDCAALRIKIRLLEAAAKVGGYRIQQASHQSGYYPNGVNFPKPATTATWVPYQDPKTIKVPPPDPQNLDRAIAALEIYQTFGRLSPDGLPKVDVHATRWDGGFNSDWYQLGIDDLVVASRVLAQFNDAPEFQAPVADQLATLRARARSVAAFITSQPTIHASYFVGDQPASRDQLNGPIMESPNIFRCETDWGCLWQETPEAELQLYRDLMGSAVFCYLHHDLWYPQAPARRLAAWNAADRERLPAVWQGFIRELGGSTNVLWQMEAKALQLPDAKTDEEKSALRNDLLGIIQAHRDELVTDNVELFYLGWGLGYRELEPLDQEYWDRRGERQARAAHLAEFKHRKEFLQAQKPYDIEAFESEMDEFYQDYTPEEAQELEQLFVAYKKQAMTSFPPTEMGASSARLAEMIFNEVDRKLTAIMNQPPPPPKTPPPPLTAPPPVTPPAWATRNLNRIGQPTPAEAVANVLTIDRFLPIPCDSLPENSSNLTITAHQWIENRLVLDLQYDLLVSTYDTNGNWQATGVKTFPAIALLNPETADWDVIPGPEPLSKLQNYFYYRTTLLNGQLYNCNGGKIERYDSTARQWRILPVSDGENFELFAVGGRLYAVNENLMLEITDRGGASRVLASTRRQPPASALDTEDWGTPVLFPGPGGSLRARVRSAIFTWTGNDWRDDCPAPAYNSVPDIFPGGLLIRHQSSGMPMVADSISVLDTEMKAPELLLGPKPRTNQPMVMAFMPSAGRANLAKPVWELPLHWRSARLPAAMCGSNLVLLEDYSDVQFATNQQTGVRTPAVADRDGCNTILLNYSRGLPEPQKVFLRFAAPDGCPPVAAGNAALRASPMETPPAWLLFAGKWMLTAAESPAGSMSFISLRLPGTRAGVWLYPADRLQPAIAAAQAVQRAELAADSAAPAQVWAGILAKYDTNHNGTLDPEEKEKALADPAFIRAELNEIDTNHNGWLEAPELAWFDANNDQFLEPNEHTGIDLALHLLAQKLMKQYAGDENGTLGMRDYEEMIDASLGVNANADSTLQFSRADDNHDQMIDLGELEQLMRRRLIEDLRRRESSGRTPGFIQPFEPYRELRETVEGYWRHTGDPYERQQLERFPAFGPGFRPPFMPGGPR